jgi:hypothetical protein
MERHMNNQSDFAHDSLAREAGVFSGMFQPGLSIALRSPAVAPAAASASSPAFVYNIMPLPVAAVAGHNVSLSSILTSEFGSDWGGYQDFWITYTGATTMKQEDFSYWNLKSPQATKWLVNGKDIGPDFGNQTHVSKAQVSSVELHAGNNISNFAYVMVPVAFNSSGQATQYEQFSISVVDPSLMAKNAGKGLPTGKDIVLSAEHFAKDYSGILNDNDCDKIACAVSGAAGAALNDDTTDSLKPAQNQEGGFWRIAYRGSDKGHINNWQTLVKPGDIVRMGWKNGGHHTTTVLAVNKDGSMKVFDNDGTNSKGQDIIGIHNVNYDTQTIATTITIYRLSPDHLYLINGGTQSESLVGTKFSDEMNGNGGDDKLAGGVGNDHLNGGAGNDVLTGAAGKNFLDGGVGADKLISTSGHDTFVYANASESTSKAHDTISGFNAQTDKFDLPAAVHGIDAAVAHGTLSTASFDANLTSALASHLKAHDAVLFTADAGNESGHTFLVVDANGKAGYQAGGDYVFDITGATALSHLSVHDFT